jgi:hypothetical protein
MLDGIAWRVLNLPIRKGKPMNDSGYAVAWILVLLLASLNCDGQQREYFYVPPDTSAQDKLEIDARGQPPPDPYRFIDGVTYCVRGPGFNDWFNTKDPRQWERYNRRQILPDGWCEFKGTVIEVQKEGIRVRGFCNCLGSNETTFFVVNYPYVVGENDVLPNRVAKDSGTYTYNTVMGSSSTLHKLDYGTVTSKPAPVMPSNEEIRQAKADAEKKRQEAKPEEVKQDRELADSGDPRGQRRMGERYRDGDGVKKNLDAAYIWLGLAAGKGDKKAAEELDELSKK